MSSYKLNLTKVLTNINASNFDFIDTLSDEELKGFTPYVLIKYLKHPDCNFEVRNILLNEVLNPYIISLSKHPKLLYKLMCIACGMNDGARYNYMKTTNNTDMRHKIIGEYYEYTYNEGLEVINIFNDSDFIEMAEDMGYDSKDIKKVKGDLSAKVV